MDGRSRMLDNSRDGSGDFSGRPACAGLLLSPDATLLALAVTVLHEPANCLCCVGVMPRNDILVMAWDYAFASAVSANDQVAIQEFQQSALTLRVRFVYVEKNLDFELRKWACWLHHRL